MLADYFAILEVDRTASPEQIKEAFRKKSSEIRIALFKEKTESGKKALNEQLKEVTTAYNVLSDASRRAEYVEQLRSPGGDPRRKSRDSESRQEYDGDGFDFSNLFSRFNRMSSVFGERGGEWAWDTFSQNWFAFDNSGDSEIGTDVNLTLRIDIVAFYFELSFELTYNYLALCKECRDGTVCPQCLGRGVVPFVSGVTTCSVCWGNRRIYGGCSSCGHSRFVTKDRKVKISMKQSHILRVSPLRVMGLGNEGRRTNGDLVVQMHKVLPPHIKDLRNTSKTTEIKIELNPMERRKLNEDKKLLYSVFEHGSRSVLAELKSDERFVVLKGGGFSGRSLVVRY